MNEAHLRLAIVRSESLQAFYDAERRAGATPLEANEAMHFFAKRLDALYEAQHAAVDHEMRNAS